MSGSGCREGQGDTEGDCLLWVAEEEGEGSSAPGEGGQGEGGLAQLWGEGRKVLATAIRMADLSCRPPA